jgi:hypothetical protein
MSRVRFVLVRSSFVGSKLGMVLSMLSSGSIQNRAGFLREAIDGETRSHVPSGLFAISLQSAPPLPVVLGHEAHATLSPGDAITFGISVENRLNSPVLNGLARRVNNARRPGESRSRVLPAGTPRSCCRRHSAPNRRTASAASSVREGIPSLAYTCLR